MSHLVSPAALLPDEVRGRLYALLAPLQVLLVTFGVFNDEAATLWISAVTAALGLGVAAVNATSSLRAWAYGLLAPAQALLIWYGVANESQVSAVAALVATALGFGVAAAKTPHLG